MKIWVSFEQTDHTGKRRRGTYCANLRNDTSLETVEAHLASVLNAIDQQIDSTLDDQNEDDAWKKDQ